MRTILTWTLTLPALSAALALACSSEPLDDTGTLGAGGADGGGAGADAGAGATDATCATFANMLIACGLLEGTRLAGCTNEDPVLACAAACVSKADCTALEAAYCDASFNDFAACIDVCRAALPPPEFVCDDGARIAASWRCDGAEDCAGGEDERCPTGVFTCKNGLNIPSGWQCDTFEDCADGEDELDCPNGPMVSCDDGTRLSARRDCDGVPDCAGGEDESDCAMLVCR